MTHRARGSGRRRLAALACCSLGAVLTMAPAAPAQEPEPISVVEVEVTNQAELDQLVRTASDVTEHIEYRGDQRFVQIVTTDSEMALLRAHGFKLGRVLDTEAQMRARTHPGRQMRAAGDDGILQNVAEGEHIKILRADYFTNEDDEHFISVEGKSDQGRTDALTVRWDSGPGTEMGSGGSTTLSPFVDAGQYLYHRRQIEVDGRPDKVEVSSAATGERLEGAVKDWAPPTDETGNPEIIDFIDPADPYLDPTQAYDRIKQLAQEFPNITELIELPYQTNGYRRKAQAQFGDTEQPGSVVVVESKNYGSEGGNNVRVTLRDPGAADQDLSIDVNRDTIVVNLETDEAGEIDSTAADVVEAINERVGSPAIAFTYRGSVGDGVVPPAPETRLVDNLDAPAHVSRRPHSVWAIRVGNDLSGDKIGVYAYSQEHAREWVTPLVAVETAERLVRNYAINPNVRRLLNNVEVFILPSVNPDGGHYSFYDFAGQRKNMTDHCGDEAGDFARSNSWGVDINRNYSVGTYFDGYVGGSGSCTSGTFSGPFEYSEPESKNVEWIADNFPNIRFSMNIHSSGNFFMWPPGAYTPERVTLPRPTLGEESYFWGAAGQVVGAIRNWRGLTVTPRQTGPVADVLYSAAGNSGDELWYENGIYGWDFEIGTSFQPNPTEAHNVAMEFSNGLYELIKIADRFASDGRGPQSSLDLRPDFDGEGVRMKFRANEPATVYYRLDGRRPTYGNSTMYVGAGDREGGETIVLDETTTVTWFAVDAAGNVERNYKPDDGSVSNLYRRQVVQVPAAGAGGGAGGGAGTGEDDRGEDEDGDTGSAGSTGSTGSTGSAGTTGTTPSASTNTTSTTTTNDAASTDTSTTTSRKSTSKSRKAKAKRRFARCKAAARKADTRKAVKRKLAKCRAAKRKADRRAAKRHAAERQARARN